MHRYRALNEGPNGLAVDSRRVYGATDSDAFALSAATGRQLWSRHLTSATEQFVDIAPVVWEGLVFTSTVGFPPGGRGAIYALDAATGVVRWKFDTIRDPWRYPLEAGGGGLWYPVSVDAQGRLYAGSSNPAPWGGSPERPNGAALPRPGAVHELAARARCAERPAALARPGDAARRPRLRLRGDPILATVEGKELVLGAGKAGRVIAWDRETRRRRWATAGRSAPQRPRPAAAPPRDRLPRPVRRSLDADGLRGGPVVRPRRRPVRVGERHRPPGADDRRPIEGKGRLVALDAATGRPLVRRLPSPNFGCATVSNDVVFTSTFDGTVYAFAGADGKARLARADAGGGQRVPAVLGDLVLFRAGAPRAGGVTPEVVAFGLP